MADPAQPKQQKVELIRVHHLSWYQAEGHGFKSQHLQQPLAANQNYMKSAILRYILFQETELFIKGNKSFFMFLCIGWFGSKLHKQMQLRDQIINFNLGGKIAGMAEDWTCSFRS